VKEVKRNRNKRPATPASEPTPEQLHHYMQKMEDEHQQAWHQELMGKAPYWECLIGMHLRLVELEHMETAVRELL